MRARLLAVVAATLGCGHKLESPTPHEAGVSPRLACSEQLTSPIQVMGDNLTPLPTKTLKDQEQLNLPQVSLTEETDLAGMAMSGMPISIADDPNNPSASHLRWESEQQLTFDVYPQLMLMSGVYDVTVTNPDGQSATFKDALAIVPPPVVIDVVPPNICDAQSDQTIKIDGMNFLQNGTDTPTVTILGANGMPALPSPLPTTTMGCTAVATSVMQGIQECTVLNFVVKEGSLPVGMYTLVVTNPAPAGCASTESISFVVEPPPTLTAVLPTHICQGGGTLDLKGTGFLPGAMASLKDDQTMMNYPASSTTVVNDMEAQAHFHTPGGFTVGDTMDVTIQNLDGCFATLPMA